MGGRGPKLRAGFTDHVDTQIFARFAHSVIARSPTTKQSHWWDRHLAGHLLPRTSIMGPVWIPGGTSRETRDCLSLNDGQDAPPTKEGIASGLWPRNDSRILFQVNNPERLFLSTWYNGC